MCWRGALPACMPHTAWIPPSLHPDRKPGLSLGSSLSAPTSQQQLTLANSMFCKGHSFHHEALSNYL